jgi:hypothetical protein
VNPERTLSSTFWAMVLVQVVGSTDIFTPGPRKLPAPKQFVAIGVLWSIFHMAEGTRLARPAAALSALVLLTAMVLGPFGPQFLGFLAYVGQRFSLAPATPAGGASLTVPPAGPNGGVLA